MTEPTPTGPTSTGPASTDPAEVRHLRAAGHRMRVIDVRTPAEFAAAHIPGSSNVPLDLLRDHRDALAAAHRDPVVLVCATGRRATEAGTLLAGAGLSRVEVLRGGITAWEGAGGDVRRGRGPWPMERQVRLTAGTIVLAAVLGSVVCRPLKWVAAMIGGGLAVAALTDTCAMAKILGRLPHNRALGPGTPALLHALTAETGTAS